MVFGDRHLAQVAYIYRSLIMSLHALCSFHGSRVERQYDIIYSHITSCMMSLLCQQQVQTDRQTDWASGIIFQVFVTTRAKNSLDKK